jgi:hypothetical protein
MFKDAEYKNVNLIHLDSETDAINNYYMHKYRLKSQNPPKVKLKIPDVFIKILSSVENSYFPHKQSIMMYILDLPTQAIEKFKSYIEKIKSLFHKDGNYHDCSIMANLWGKKVGFTFMTGANKAELDQKLDFFIQYKMSQQEADIWIGLGDAQRSKDDFDIQSGFVAKHHKF